jgi:ketosteroid isomerase-like protein
MCSVAARELRGKMSDQTESLVRDAFQALGRGDMASLLQLVDPEFEWTFLDPGEEDPKPQVCHGTSELARALRYGVDQPARELDELVPFGERVLVVTRLVTDGGTAWSAAGQSFHVVTVRDGRITALRACRSRDEALVHAKGA